MKGKSGIAYVVLLAAFAAFVLYLTFGKKERGEVSLPPVAEGTSLSQEPYLEAMSDLEGNEVDMEKDKLVFLNVWATWCGPCIMEMPGIQSLYERYKSHEKVRFYVVSDEGADIVSPFIARKGYELPFYIYD